MGDDPVLRETEALGRATRGYIPLIIVGVGLLATAFFGTALYNYYIPNIAGKKDFSLGLALIAAFGGVTAFLSPCAFGMLPAYFAFFLSVRGQTPESGGRRGSVLASLKYGSAVAAGMLAAGAILATAIALLGATFAPGLRVVTAEPNQVTRAIRLVAGILLMSMALLFLLGYRFPQLARLRPPRTVGMAARSNRALGRSDVRPSLWFFGYGLLYVLVALPCTANVMAAPLLHALAIGGPEAAAGTALVFLATMAAMSLVASVIIGLSKDQVIRNLKASARYIQLVSAVFFLAIGLILIYLSVNLSAFRETFFHFPIK